MKTLEFTWKDLDKLAELVAALEYHSAPYRVEKTSEGILLTFGK